MLKGSFISVFLILSLLINAILCSSIFSSSPDVTFNTTSKPATEIKISPSKDKIAFGFSNGNIQIYTTKGYKYYSFYGHYSKIIDIQWNYGLGLITLDQSGKAIIWSDYGIQLHVWQFNNTVYDMTLKKNFSISFSFANKIQEYFTTNYTLRRTYLPENGYQFRKIQYDSQYTIIYAGYNNSYIQLFSTYTGKTTGSPIYVYGNIQSFSQKGNQDKVIGLSSNNYLIQIDSYGQLTQLGTVTSSSRVAACYGVKAIILSQSYSSNVNIYDYNGLFKQNLKYLSHKVTAITCDFKTLVTVDPYGYVTINTAPTPIDGWIITIVAICGSICFIICFGIICCMCKKKKKKNKLLMLNQYQNIDNGINKVPIKPINPPQPYFANQGYNNMGNQGYNNMGNQGYNNMGNQGYNNNYINPIQQTYNKDINNGYFNDENKKKFVIPSTNLNNQLNPYKKEYSSNNIIIKSQY